MRVGDVTKELCPGCRVYLIYIGAAVGGTQLVACSKCGLVRVWDWIEKKKQGA